MKESHVVNPHVSPRAVWLCDGLADIRSQAHCGLYWAHKIRGGVDLARFRKNKNSEHEDMAVAHLQEALQEWRYYVAQLGASCENVRFAGHGVFDWEGLTSDVKIDIEIARNSNWPARLSLLISALDATLFPTP